MEIKAAETISSLYLLINTQFTIIAYCISSTYSKTTKMQKLFSGVIIRDHQLWHSALTIGKGLIMFWAISLLLLICWYVGLLTGYTLDGIINILLVIAIIMMLVRVIQEKIYCKYLGDCQRKSRFNEGEIL